LVSGVCGLRVKKRRGSGREARMHGNRVREERLRAGEHLCVQTCCESLYHGRGFRIRGKKRGRLDSELERETERAVGCRYLQSLPAALCSPIPRFQPLLLQSICIFLFSNQSERIPSTLAPRCSWFFDVPTSASLPPPLARVASQGPLLFLPSAQLLLLS